MKLRKPCPEHLRYEEHWFHPHGQDEIIEHCPGGVFLPDDTLIIEKVDGLWPQWATDRLYGMIRRDLYSESYVLDGLLDALSVREAE